MDLGGIFGDIAKAAVTTGIKSLFGSSKDTPRVAQLSPGQAPGNLRVPNVEAGTPANAAQAGSTTAASALIDRHLAIMASIDVPKGASFSAETTRIA